MIDAYIAGLERRVAAGERVDGISSVASFFVSRVDAKADPLLPAGSDLRGRVAIANAHRAYARYRERFADERWRALRDAGARPQRPLWASTGTKDPSLLRRALRRGADRPGRHQHDAGGHPARLRRPRQRRPTRSASMRRRPRTHSSGPSDEGIDLAAITTELEREGVRSFCDSYHQLLHCIEAKKARIATAGENAG